MAQHSKLGARVAIVAVERIADEAAVAGPGGEQGDLALELLGGGARVIDVGVHVEGGYNAGLLAHLVG